jgi:excisionase family DNA binding protein
MVLLRTTKQRQKELIVSSEGFPRASLDHAGHKGATEADGRHDGHLLTVREVADLLQVPVSWVYGRMRKRSSDRLPGYRLGKYWRFHEAEVIAWLARQRANA